MKLYETKTFNGKDLANLLNVAPPTLSGCMKKGHLCVGYDVQRWAETDMNGRLTSYEVPLSVYRELKERTPIRLNKADNKPNYTHSSVIEEPEPQKTTVNSVAAPQPQSYVEPVIAGSLGLIGKSAIENDNANSRAVIFAGVAGVFGYIAYEFTKKDATGALLGALLGLGITHLGYLSFSRSEAVKNETSKPLADHEVVNSFVNQSGNLILEPNLADHKIQSSYVFHNMI